MFSLETKQNKTIYNLFCIQETQCQWKLLLKNTGCSSLKVKVCKFCLQGRVWCREKPTQNSPQEFLTIQYSAPSSATPQPATDTMWFGKDRGWNSEKIPPEYSSKPLVAIRAQLKNRVRRYCSRIVHKMWWCIIERALLWAQVRVKI